MEQEETEEHNNSLSRSRENRYVQSPREPSRMAQGDREESLLDRRQRQNVGSHMHSAQLPSSARVKGRTTVS